MFVYISTFYTYSAVGSMLLFAVLGEFFAGLIIPVPLMPSLLKKIVYFLPFRYTSDLPFRIYSGNIPLSEAYVSIGIQLILDCSTWYSRSIVSFKISSPGCGSWWIKCRVYFHYVSILLAAQLEYRTFFYSSIDCTILCSFCSIYLHFSFIPTFSHHCRLVFV